MDILKDYMTPENVSYVIHLIVALSPVWLPIILKVRSSLSARNQAILDLIPMAFNRVQTWKKYAPKKIRAKIDTRQKVIEEATQLYLDAIPQRGLSSIISAIFGTSKNQAILKIIAGAEALHASKKIALSITEKKS